MKVTRSRTIKLFVILFSCAFIFLCGCTHVDNGVVIEKTFTPSHHRHSTVFLHSGKNTILIPQVIYTPDSWKILVKNGDKKEWWSVSKKYYESISIGDNVNRRGEETK